MSDAQRYGVASFETYTKGLLLRIAERRERILQESILSKLCGSGRILPNEHIATIEHDYGFGQYCEQYFMPEKQIQIKSAYRDWETDRKSTRLNSSH